MSAGGDAEELGDVSSALRAADERIDVEAEDEYEGDDDHGTDAASSAAGGSPQKRSTSEPVHDGGVVGDNFASAAASADYGFLAVDNTEGKLDDPVTYKDMVAEIDDYFEDIDKMNYKCRCLSYVAWAVLAVGFLSFVVGHVFISQRAYQRAEGIVGTANVVPSGGAQSGGGKVFDASDLVFGDGLREEDAIFIATGFFEATPQTRWAALADVNVRHQACAGSLQPCTCADATADCPVCAAGTTDDDGERTGRCVDTGAGASASKPDLRCEVRAWCPVLEVDRARRLAAAGGPNGVPNGAAALDEASTGQYQMDAGVEQVRLAVSVRAKSDADVGVGQAISFYEHGKNLTVGQILGLAGLDAEAINATRSTGALLYVRVVYDCDLDWIEMRSCKPTWQYYRIDRTAGAGAPLAAATLKSSMSGNVTM